MNLKKVQDVLWTVIPGIIVALTIVATFTMTFLMYTSWLAIRDNGEKWFLLGVLVVLVPLLAFLYFRKTDRK